jgi:hypothetical protein
MRLAAHIACIALLWGLAGCRTGFRCGDSTGCLAGSVCVALAGDEAYCAVSDATCDGGRRFEDSAASYLAGSCVPAGAALRGAVCALDEVNVRIDECVLGP